MGNNLLEEEIASLSKIKNFGSIEAALSQTNEFNFIGKRVLVAVTENWACEHMEGDITGVFDVIILEDGANVWDTIDNTPAKYGFYYYFGVITHAPTIIEVEDEEGEGMYKKIFGKATFNTPVNVREL